MDYRYGRCWCHCDYVWIPGIGLSEAAVTWLHSLAGNTARFGFAMADKYRSFSQLLANETEGVDFQIRSGGVRNGVLLIAPHGGGIEPGTSELAEAIAGNDYGFYCFEGIKPEDNANLHVTSTRFVEPQALMLVADAQTVIATHGCEGSEPAVYLGGRDEDLKQRIEAELNAAGFNTGLHSDPNLQARSHQNICNRGARGQGVQLELTRELRRSMFRSLTAIGRQETTPVFAGFVAATRAAIACS